MKRIILALVLSVLSFGANAALIDRGDGFIYDSDQDITWTENGSINGLGNWYGQVAWADGYSQTHSVYGTFDDWRLPTTLQPDPSCDVQYDPGGGFSVQGRGDGCTGSEMGHLFNVYGISSGTWGPFSYVENYFYWSGTDYAPNNSSAWTYYTHGSQFPQDKLGYFVAWAVMDGDVAASVVPIPATVYLFASGLGLLGWFRKKS